MDTVVMTARGGGLVNGDTRKDREVGVQALPDPARQHLARRIFQAGDIVQTDVVELVVKRRPNGLDQVEIDAHIAIGEVLVRVKDDLEAVSVHTTALMPFGHIGQTMRRLETKASPNVGLVGAIEIDPLVRGTLDSDRDDPGDVQVCAHPAREILVGRDRQVLIEVAVIERSHTSTQRIRQGTRLAPGERRPCGRELRTNLGGEAVPVKTPRTVAGREDRDPPRGLERDRGNVI
jgi:hypothetical protein